MNTPMRNELLTVQIMNNVKTSRLAVPATAEAVGKKTNELAKLRSRMAIEPAKPVQVSFSQFLRDFASDWFSFLFPAAPVNPMCKNYGHVISPTLANKANNPLCIDCGKAITDPEQLRKSVVNSAA